MDSRIVRARLQGSNPSPWIILYIIRNLLKRRSLKWVRITHLDIWNTSYDQKKGRVSKWQFDSRPQKVRNQLDFLACRRRATYSWKALDKGYNFSLDLITIEGLHAKLCAPKVVGVLTLRISRLPSGTKSHLDVAPVERCRVYYKGEGGGFPQVRVMVSLVSPNCPWLFLTPKVLQQCTKHLVLVLCRFLWVIEAWQLFLVPSWSSSTPYTPLKCCEPGSVLRLPTLLMFSIWTQIWIPQGVGSVSLCQQYFSFPLIVSLWNSKCALRAKLLEFVHVVASLCKVWHCLTCWCFIFVPLSMFMYALCVM